MGSEIGAPRLTVDLDREFRRVEVGDRLSAAVHGAHVDGDHIDAGAEGWLLRLRGGTGLPLRHERRSNE